MDPSQSNEAWQQIAKGIAKNDLEHQIVLLYCELITLDQDYATAPCTSLHPALQKHLSLGQSVCRQHIWTRDSLS